MAWQSMKLAHRLYAGFGGVLAILAVVTGVAIVKVGSINEALRANSDFDVPIQRYAINFRGSAHDRAIAIRDFVMATGAAERDQEAQTIERLAGFYAESSAPMERLLAAPEAPAELAPLYRAIRDVESRTVAATQAIQAQVRQGNTEAAQQMLWQQAKPLYVEWLAKINALIDFQEKRIQAANRLALDQAGGFLSLMLVALTVALLAGGTLAWWLSRGIVTQLGAEPTELGEAAQRVASGDLGPVPGADRAPAGSVLASLGAMQQGLASLVGSVRGAAESMATGSQEIANGNADLSQRTETQASHVQSTTQLMSTLARSVQSNAEIAGQANAMASQASSAAETGGAVVSQVVSTMDEISASSKRIADIIGVIDGIAFQTNILALNAAVEAARAGEQGRGFAVVASEVRALAQRSADAAREIKALIGASVDRVEHGSRLVADAGHTMEDLVGQVKRVSSLIGDISAATQHQSQDIGTVDRSMNELETTTQQNAALVEESAAAADSLRQQAAQLADLVRRFRLER